MLTADSSANKFRCQGPAPSNQTQRKDRHISTPLTLQMGYSCKAVGYQTVKGHENPQSQVCPDTVSFPLTNLFEAALQTSGFVCLCPSHKGSKHKHRKPMQAEKLTFTFTSFYFLIFFCSFSSIENKTIIGLVNSMGHRLQCGIQRKICCLYYVSRKNYLSARNWFLSFLHNKKI